MSIHGRFLFAICMAPALPLVACKVYDPLYCDEQTGCTNPDRPFCDLEGEYPDSEGVPRTCIADPDPDLEADAGPGADSGGGSESFCVAGEFVQCTDEDSAIYCNEDGTEYVGLDCDSACDPERQGCSCDPNTTECSDGETVHCGPNGQVQEVEACALGCNDTGARCIDVEPSNGLGGYLDMTDEAPVVVLANGALIDTDNGIIEDGDGSLVDVPTFQITAPPGGVTIRVIAVKSLTIGDATISGTRALAVVSDGDIHIGGHVRILAGATDEGDCVGRVGGRGPLSPGGCCQAIGGGGGGGFGQAGGDGGTATMNGTGAGGTGGADIGDFSLVPLHGGCSGGGQSTGLPIGGAGGGAIQLVSRTQIRVEDGSGEARLNAGGKVGAGANMGGGSGGGILLEAPRVILASGALRAVANGAGGSSVCGPPDPQDGTLTSMRALGGGQGCSDPLFGVGGNGGASAGGATAGGDASSSQTNLVMGGGGGGGVGRIRANVPARPDYMGENRTSPSASVGTLATR